MTNTKTVILNSGQCRYGTCYACGWGQKKYPVNIGKLKNKVKSLNLKEIDKLKVYESGSYLDNKQFPKEFREWLVQHLKKQGVQEIVVESLPNFITEEKLQEFDDLDYTIAIGLEAADDEVLEEYGKPFRLQDYEEAIEKIHSHGGKVKTYIMVNIPFSKENTLQKSMEYTLDKSDEIVLINTYPHNQSKLFDDWVDGKWKPLNREEFLNKVDKWKDLPEVSIEYENMYFLPKFPEEKKEDLKGCSIDLITHPHYRVWQEYFQKFYQKPEEKEILLLLPCSYKKPYYQSNTHKSIHNKLKETGKDKKIHRVVVSSAGVIPIDKCDNYPFTAYDWPEWEETPEIKEKYIEVNTERVKKYLENQDYDRVLAYFKPDSESWKAVEKAAEQLELEIKNLFTEETYKEVKDERNPVAKKKALEDLKQGIEEET